MFRAKTNIIAEGGNVSSTSPGWQGAADQEAEEIDLKIHDRDFMVGQLRTLLAAQNESFKAAYGKYIWDPKLLKSGQMFSGSSLQFFDVKGVNTQDFMNKLKKTKVGDIDTQIDQDMGEEVTAWLKSIIGKKVGNGTFLGFNSSLSSIWLLDDPQVRVQVDYELGPYDPKTKAPTEWFAYSHSSHYDDMAAGIKGVFHKYINRALTHAQASTKYVARVLKKGVKISDAPVTDSDYSFAVSSAQGGGMSMKYKPYIDPQTGQPMEKDGIPVMQQLDPKDRDYIQNLDQQFQINFGRKRTASDKNLQGSFVGTIQLMNKSFSPEQNEAVARAFLDILFGPGSQMITKDDPARDRDVKFAAVDAMLLGGNGIKPLNLPNGAGLRQEAVKMAMDYADKFAAKKAGKTVDMEVAEDADAAAAAKPNYARQGIKHIYNRLPDGRVSSMEMSNTEFQQVAQEIADNGGNLNGMAVNLKVDGAGIRFGKDASGRPFMMTSKVTTPLYQDDVGYFTSYGQEKGQDPETLARTQKYDDALALITGSKFIQTLPPDTIVQAEMMYVPMAQKTDQGLKFVNISYDPKKLGRQMTLVPFMVKQYSTGEDLPNADRIIKRLTASSDNNIKIISNRLEQKGINVNKIIQPILGLNPKDKESKPLFDQAKQELSDAIINSPKLAGKDALGDNMEGVVVNLPSGRLFKVTSQQMKSAMAAKKTPHLLTKKEGPLKTAVVAIGSFVGHIGHEQLWDYTIKRAAELGADPYLFIGNAQGKDDPIPPSVKVQTWHKMYPQYAKNISTVTQEGGSLLQKIKHELINPLPGKPPRYDNIIIMVGEDQAGLTMPQALMKAVNKFQGYEHVKVTLEPTPRGTGMSFTKLRNILKDPNATPDQQYALWAQGFDEAKLGKDWILKLMDITRKGMGITQQPQPQPQPVAESRLFNELIRPSTSIEEDWQKVNKKDKTDGMSQKAVNAYRRENPGSKLKTAVTTKPSKLKKGSKSAKRRKSFCARMSGMKKAHASAKTKRDPDSPINKALRRWNCEESVGDKEYRNWGEYEYETQAKAGSALDYIHEINPEIFTRHGDEFMMDLAGKIAAQNPSASITQIAGNILRHLKTMYEDQSQAIKQTAHSLTNPPKIMQHRAKRDQEREQQLKYRDTVGRDQKQEETMLPKSSFAGSDKNKLGPAAHLKGNMKRPARQGDFVGGEGVAEGLGLYGPFTVTINTGERPKSRTKTKKFRREDDAILWAQDWLEDAPQYVFATAEVTDPDGNVVWTTDEQGVAEAGKIKGADGKACWKGKRYAGTKNGKDICIPVSEDVENIMAALIDKIIVNEAVSSNKSKS